METKIYVEVNSQEEALATMNKFKDEFGTLEIRITNNQIFASVHVDTEELVKSLNNELGKTFD